MLSDIQPNSIGKKERIESLQALRALAFLGVFFLHAKFFISWAELGVSVFFVLSGFLMAYRYENVEFHESFKNNFIFSIKKIKKLYPLHIITMIFAIILYIISMIRADIIAESIVPLFKRIGLNLFLVQAWAPRSYFNTSLNGVAWYLSATMFLYFVFPWIKKITERNTIIKLCIICGIIWILEIVVCIPLIVRYGINSPVYIWFMYCFPVFRLGDFFIGCVLKRVFFESNVRFIGQIKSSIFEVIAVIITVVVLLWIKMEQSNVVLLAMHNKTTIYIPIAAMWVLLFAINKGIITRVLSNKLTCFVGNLSAYAFLIHYVITRYISEMLSYMNIEVIGWGRAVFVFVELVVSIVLSVFYRKIHERYYVGI